MDFLPSDDELIRRENIFLGLFNKFNVDEGSDPELIDDVNTSTVSEASSDSGSSYSEMSGYETEDSYDLNEMKKQLQPVVNDRVNSWPEKGIHFQLKTVDRGVTVEEWLKANKEFTTTTKKYKKTIINENNKTTTVTTKTTKTTTSRTSFKMIRNKDANNIQLKAIDNGESSNEKERMEQRNESPHQNENFVLNDLISSKRFALPARNLKQSKFAESNVLENVSSQLKVPLPNKVKRLTPQKKTMSRTKSKSKRKDSQSEKASEDIAVDYENVIANDVTREIGIDDDVFDNIEPVQEQSDRNLRKEKAQTFIKNKTLFKPRQQEIVVYSPGSRKRNRTKIGKIGNEFVVVTKKELMERIDPKYHQYIDFSSMKKCIVPTDQRLVYQPPIDVERMEADASDDSEIDDDLLTSYTTAGHFYRLNSM